MRFAKLHGLGNDFVLIDLRGQSGAAILPDEEFAQRVCDRRLGVGADGILTLTEVPESVRFESELPGARLTIHNPDGSKPEMCGNGARCAALWMATRRCTESASGEVILFTDAGVRRCSVVGERGKGEVEIGMGPPEISAQREFSLRGEKRLATPVSMGNPHRVFFLGGSIGEKELTALCASEGPRLCAEENANIEFVKSLGPQRFRAAVWERGAGATLACGTGACAVAARGDRARSRESAICRSPSSFPAARSMLKLEAGEMKMRGLAQLVFLRRAGSALIA